MKNLFGGAYKNKRVFITGHTGFKGSWLYLWLQQLGADVRGFALKPDTSPAHIQLLNLFEETSVGDINELKQIQAVFKSFQPEIVFHLAAQPLVKTSYELPILTFQTNIIGSANILEAVRGTPSVKAIVNITTDKVYENHEWVWPYRETDRLGGHDPYSSSKACVELLHESYRKSYFNGLGILSATARAGNVIGGGDWAKYRLIPDVIRASVASLEAEIRNPDSVRPWQHVLDPLAGYLVLGMFLLQDKKEMEGNWNFGPATNDCLSVRQVLSEMQHEWINLKWKDTSLHEKVHEANVLRLDCSKSKALLNWQPVWDVYRALRETADWYKNYYETSQTVTLQQLQQFVKDAQAKNLNWSMQA